MNDQLIGYLKSHNVQVIEDNGDSLSVLTSYSNDGHAMKVPEQVPASWGAVREYLGY